MSKEESAGVAVGVRLRTARELAGLSQGQVAKKMGLHRPSISEAEAGRRRVSAVELSQFADIYAVDIAWLASGNSGGDDPHRANIELAARELSKMQPQDVNRLLDILKVIRKERGSADGK